MKDYYNKNMRALKKSNKSIYKRVQKYQKSEEVEIRRNIDEEDVIALVNDSKNNIKIYVETTKSGDRTIRVKKGDKDIYFHSKYDPKREAKRKIKEFKPKKNKQIFSLGFGLGYQLKEIIKRNKYDKLIIIEPYMSIFYTALNFIDLTSLFQKKNLIYIVNNNSSLFDVIRAYFSISLEKDLSFLENSPSIKLFEKEYKNIYQQIREGINYKKVKLTTDLVTAQAWRNNTIKNLHYIFKSPKADEFFGEFEKFPAICVSAGPSLDKNINKIKKAEGKAIIMCVGTALKALLKNDIEPDIVVTIDHSENNYKHFKDINNIPDSILFVEFANNFKINNKWGEKQVFFTMKRNFSGWIENLKGNYSVIKTGGTVAHSMVDLAYKFGADPIVLVGQDLAFFEDKTHASGTTYEGQKVNNNNLLKVEGIKKNYVLTDKSFMTMLSYFNNYFAKRPDRTFIDATEGGAKIKHTKIMKLNNVINDYCIDKDKMNVKEILKDKFKKYKPDFQKKNLETAIEKFLKELDEGIKLTKEQLNKIKNKENEIKHVNNISELSPQKFQKVLKSYENKLKSLDSAKYCTEGILIPESMKYKEVKAKYYLDKIKEFKEKLKYYRNYRVRYLQELEKSRKLLVDLYTNNS